MTAARIASTLSLRDGLNGWHVLAILVAFFAIVFAVNGVFLYVALSTHTGVVANEPYRMGLNYNDRIDAEAAQQRLGWTVDVADVSSAHAVRVTITDKSGTPVAGIHAVATLGRPSTSKFDARLELREIAPGTYSAALPAIESGAWILDIAAQRGLTDNVYRLRRRLWLKL